MDPTIRIRNAEGSLDPEGFPGYQNRLRSLVWIWCGQPGRLENLSSTLTEAATAELRSLGTFDLAFQLDGVFTGLHEQSVKADARRVGRTPASFRYRPAAGVFWRRVFTAFSDAFDIPVLTDPRLAYGDLRGPKAPVRKTVISVDAQTAPDTATLPALLSSVPTMSAHTAKMLRIERPVKPTNVPRDARWDELYLVIDAHRFGHHRAQPRGTRSAQR
jgi:hypothetical protein